MAAVKQEEPLELQLDTTAATEAVPVPGADKSKFFAIADDDTLQNEEETKAYQHPALAVVLGRNNGSTVGISGGKGGIRHAV